MPELPNRDQNVARFAGVLKRATTDQKRRLVAAMGWPPDMARVPATLWLEIEREQTEAARGPLAAMFLVAAGAMMAFTRREAGYIVVEEIIVAESLSYGQHRAEQLAAGIVETTKQRLTAAADAVTEDNLAPSAFREKVNAAFGEERALSVAGTEATTAASNGEGTVQEHYEADTGGVMQAIWRHRNRLVFGSHPCPLCAQLIGTTQDEWPAIDPEAIAGPPRHPNCDCELTWRLLSADEAQSLTGRAPIGSPQLYADAYARIGSSGRNNPRPPRFTSQTLRGPVTENP